MLSISKLSTGQHRYYLDQADERVDVVESVGDGVEEYYIGGTEARGESLLIDNTTPQRPSRWDARSGQEILEVATSCRRTLRGARLAWLATPLAQPSFQMPGSSSTQLHE